MADSLVYQIHGVNYCLLFLAALLHDEIFVDIQGQKKMTKSLHCMKQVAHMNLRIEAVRWGTFQPMRRSSERGDRQQG